MALSDKDIEKFQSLYLRRYGTEISEQQAIEMGNQLVNLFRAIFKPSPQLNLTELNQIKTCSKQNNQQVF